MKKLILRILILVVLLVVVALAAGVFFLGSIVKSGVEKVGPAVTKVPVKLDSAAISVFGGNGELKGFSLGNPEGFKSSEAIKVGTMSLSLSPMSVLGDKVIIRSVKVLGPEITYETDLKGSNLGKILDNMGGDKPAGEKPPVESKPASGGKGAQKKLQVDEFVITGAKVHLAATMLGSAPPLSIPEIRLTNLGQGSEGITAAELSQRVMSALYDATQKVVTDYVVKSGGKGAELLKTPAAESVKKGIGDFLKK